MFPWHVTSCASTRTVDCLMMPSVRQEDLIHLDIKEQLSVFRKKFKCLANLCLQVQNRVDLTFYAGSCPPYKDGVWCGFCLLYVRGKHISDLFFTDQCWQGQGGGQRTGVVTAASVTMWFLRFAVLYRHKTHACWSALAALLATAHSRR